ncbi:MAG: hypothetical protein DMG24_00210 [Acidobacteria bacterium]|nr:MAG: hypothetical protein DMG24_00210 [Acidobacteriota bacterium]
MCSNRLVKSLLALSHAESDSPKPVVGEGLYGPPAFVSRGITVKAEHLAPKASVRGPPAFVSRGSTVKVLYEPNPR